MDPLSHVLLGAVTSQAVYGRRLGRMAAAVGGLAAFLPDADVFIRSATDPLLAVEYHRGFTHALAFAPVGGAAIAALWLLRSAWRSHWPVLWACATLAWVSHCLLDAATSYGTQLFWPFSRHRVGWDLISIIDPLFTLTLATGLVWSLVRAQVRPVRIALGLAVTYLAVGGIQLGRATALQRELAEARGHVPDRHVVMPTLANNVVWRALYLHHGQIFSDRIRVGWFSRPTVVEGWSLPLLGAGGLTGAERERNTAGQPFQRFAWFSDGWVARTPGDPTFLADMRYSLTTEAFDPIWGIRFNGLDSPAAVTWVNRSREREIKLRDLWREIFGRDPRYGPVLPEISRLD